MVRVKRKKVVGKKIYEINGGRRGVKVKCYI